MIFAVPGHIEQIKQRTKTETRRGFSALGRYRIGRTYSIQPKRTAKGIPDGRILVKDIWPENCFVPITEASAKAEGGYGVEEYEKLYKRLNPQWQHRAAIRFEFIPTITSCSENGETK